MANKIHAIKFLNWLFLRIKPSDYDPTKPLEFEGGIGGGASLPDQTGNAGKVLRTNGTDAEWTDDYLPLTGGEITGVLTLNAEKVDYNFQAGPILRIKAETKDGRNKVDTTIKFSPLGKGEIHFNRVVLKETGNVIPYGNGTHKLGDSTNKWSTIFATKLNNGADINIPTEGGTMARLEDLQTTETNVSDLGDQVQGIEERIPGHASTTNLLATMTDAGKHLKSPTDTDASFCLQFGDLVMCGGTVAFNNLEPGHAKEMVADLPVKMAGDYLVVCTPTADTYFDHLISEYGEKMSDMFIISCDNMGDAQATNVKVSWIAIGKKGA